MKNYIYSTEDFFVRLEKARIYRNIKNGSIICKEIGVSRQNWTNWSEKGYFPAIDFIIKLAAYLELDIRYFIIKDAEPIDFDLRATWQSDNQDDPNSHCIVPFVQTTVSRKIIKIMNDVLLKTGIYAITNKHSNGLSASLHEFRRQSKHRILYYPCCSLLFDFSNPLDQIDLIIFDGIHILSDELILKIFSYKSLYKGTIVLAGRDLDNLFDSLNCMIRLTDFFYINNIIPDDFEKIVRNVFPEMSHESLNTMKSLLITRLEKLNPFFTELNRLKNSEKSFEINNEIIIQIVSALK